MPDASIADLPAQIALALSLASSSTGADYHYLVNTARTESSFQTDARAPTSSAVGLFQFIEETWIRTIKDEGPRLGLGKYADWIAKSASGHYSVDTPAHRVILLDLRNDPKISAMMAAAYARQNEDFVRNAIGRTPTSDELYIAHFLGPADAVRLITYRDRAPSFSAPELFPAAARANRPIFYGDAGARTVEQVYDLLAARESAGTGAQAADSGAFFASGIDFGSWSPQVQKIYTVPAARSQMASAAGPSLFDFFSGPEAGSAKPAAAAPAQPSAVVGDGWNASVEEPKAARPAPYITVAADYPSHEEWISGGDAGEAANAAKPMVRLASALETPRSAGAEEAEAPRLKVIHVPQD